MKGHIDPSILTRPQNDGRRLLFHLRKIDIPRYSPITRRVRVPILIKGNVGDYLHTCNQIPSHSNVAQMVGTTNGVGVRVMVGGIAVGVGIGQAWIFHAAWVIVVPAGGHIPGLPDLCLWHK